MTHRKYYWALTLLILKIESVFQVSNLNWKVPFWCEGVYFCWRLEMSKFWAAVSPTSRRRVRSLNSWQTSSAETTLTLSSLNPESLDRGRFKTEQWLEAAMPFLTMQRTNYLWWLTILPSTLQIQILGMINKFSRWSWNFICLIIAAIIKPDIDQWQKHTRAEGLEMKP